MTVAEAMEIISLILLIGSIIAGAGMLSLVIYDSKGKRKVAKRNKRSRYAEYRRMKNERV